MQPACLGNLLEFGLVPSFWTVFVVIDQASCAASHAVSSPTMLRWWRWPSSSLGVPPGTAHTILRLFEGPPESAPAGMTDWDRAFLKLLYATDQTLKTQRGAIWREMLDAVTH
jgi:hypothetical protein